MKLTFEELLNQIPPSVPRYTSYPTIPHWKQGTHEDFKKSLQKEISSLSLYFHIPFCQKMCLYCGCSVILNRKKENVDRYIDYLLREIDLVAQSLPKKHTVSQIHFGGGSPSLLYEEHLEKIFKKIQTHFSLSQDAEIAMEVDPRNIFLDDTKLPLLKSYGFNRLSFGIQDFDEHVQKEVRRFQSFRDVLKVFFQAKDLKFQTSFDLIHGLPKQTLSSIQRTALQTTALHPDRVSLFPFAYIPELKPHQKALHKELIPSHMEKMMLFSKAAEVFKKAGYKMIGMDHFACERDPLYQAFCKGSLKRNFQGYTVLPGKEVLGFGVTAISDYDGSYFQNEKSLTQYYEALDEGRLATKLCKILSLDDKRRRYVIEEILCHGRLLYAFFQKQWNISFLETFQKEIEKLQFFVDQGLLKMTSQGILVPEEGKLFLRNIASTFDAYLHS